MVFYIPLAELVYNLYCAKFNDKLTELYSWRKQTKTLPTSPLLLSSSFYPGGADSLTLPQPDCKIPQVFLRNKSRTECQNILSPVPLRYARLNSNVIIAVEIQFGSQIRRKIRCACERVRRSYFCAFVAFQYIGEKREQAHWCVRES